MKRTLTAVAATAVVVGGLGLSAAPGNAEESVTLRSGDLNTSETRSAGHNDLQADGVHVYTDDATSNAKAAAYFAVDGSLSDVANASMESTPDGDFNVKPGQQIVFDADSTTGDNEYNILVGEEVYENGDGQIEWWLTNGSSQTAKDADPSGDDNGGNGSDYFGTLEDWAEALPNAQVRAGGWSLGSGVHSGVTISSMTYGDTTYRFTSNAAETSKVHENDIRPDEDTYPGWHQGDDNGAENYTVTNDGLALKGKAQVINGYDVEDFTGAANLPLGWTMQNATYTVADGEAWFQVPVYFDYDAQGEAPKFTTLRPAAPAQAGEHTISLDDQWVSSRAIKDLVPANTPMQLSEIVAAIGGNYNVLGFGVFADTNGTATVSQITWDDTRYEFVNRAPAAKTVTVSTTARHDATTDLPTTDKDGNELDYSLENQPVNGEAELSAAGTLTYTPNKNFTGKDRVRYTVDDGRGADSTGFVNVKVTKLTGAITSTKVKPAKVTPKKRATVVVKVTAGEEAATGKVAIKDGRRSFGPKKLEDGKVSIRLAKLPKGKHTLVAKYLGNKVTTKDNAKFTVKVVKG